MARVESDALPRVLVSQFEAFATPKDASCAGFFWPVGHRIELAPLGFCLLDVFWTSANIAPV
jgi:hypothetical protein